MPLTLSEAKFAAEVAENYPSGIPMGLWGSHPLFRDTPFPKRFEKFGCPSFRVAVLRENEGKGWDPLQALVDVSNAAGFWNKGGRADIKLALMLSKNPKEIAVRLRAYKVRIRHDTKSGSRICG